MTVLATVIVLGVLIFVHELGHFAAAKAVGVEVQRFSIGLGPRVAGFTRGETEYVLSAIPLGGYVKMGGMEDEVLDRIEGGEGAGPRREPSQRDFDRKPIWARTLVISAGVVMNMVFAFGVYTFLAARYGIQELATTRVGTVVEATLPSGTEALAEVEPGSRIVTIAGDTVEHWGDVQRALLDAQPGPVTVELVEPSRALEIDLPASEDGRIALLQSLGSWIEAGVGMAEPGRPAARAGLESGDRVIAVDGEPTLNWYTFVHQIESRPGERVEITIERDGRELVRVLNLESVEEEQPDGTLRTVGKAGIGQPAWELTYRPAGLGEAVVAGYDETVRVTTVILVFLKELVTGGISPTSVGSIVTIGQASGEAARRGLDDFLRFMGLFSINLAVLNLLPIPILDGGHLVFLTIEAVRGGRALSIEQRLRWSNVGFIIIVGLMLWALSNDFLRLFGL